MYIRERNEGFDSLLGSSSLAPGEEYRMSIIEIRELIALEGERRRQLGELARRQVDHDWSLSSDLPKSSEDEPKAREEA